MNWNRARSNQGPSQPADGVKQPSSKTGLGGSELETLAVAWPADHRDWDPTIRGHRLSVTHPRDRTRRLPSGTRAGETDEPCTHRFRMRAFTFKRLSPASAGSVEPLLPEPFAWNRSGSVNAVIR